MNGGKNVVAVLSLFNEGFPIAFAIDSARNFGKVVKGKTANGVGFAEVVGAASSSEWVHKLGARGRSKNAEGMITQGVAEWLVILGENSAKG